VYLGFFALRTDARSKTNRTFAGLCASLGIWAFCYTFIYPEHDDAVRWFWYRLSGIGWTSFAAFALHFFLTISETHRVTSRPWLVALLYVPAVAFLVRLWTGTLLVDSFLTGPMGTVEVQVSGTPWHVAYSLYYLAYMVVGLGIVAWHGRRSASPEQRSQFRIIVVSGTATTLLGSVTNMALPTFGIHVVPAIAPMLILIWLFAIQYSMVRYRLMAPSLEVAVGEIISKIKDLILLTDRRGEITQVNAQVTDLFGISLERLRGRHAMVLAREPEAMRDLLQPVLAGESEGKVSDLDLVVHGEPVPMRIWTAPVRSASNQLLGSVIVAHDLRPKRRLEREVQERTAAEESLRKHNEHLGALHETTLHLIRRHEIKDVLEGLVARATSLVGASSGYIYLTTSDDPECMSLVVATGPMAAHVGHRVRRGEGVAGRVWQDDAPVLIENYRAWHDRLEVFDTHEFRAVAGIPLRTAESTMGMIGVVYEEGDPRRLGEDELKVLDQFAGLASVALDNARLYQALREELARVEKTTQKLRSARDAAEAASRAKSAFLATMSHELRTPLNAIIGYADMLEEEARDQQLEGFGHDLLRIKIASQRLLEIIQSVLDYSRIEAGNMEISAEKYEPESIVHEVAGILEPLLRQHHNALTIHIPSPIGSIIGDPTRVRQSLLNLLGNAAKFTQQGHVKVTTTQEPIDGKPWIVFQIEDDGVGMTKEQVVASFEAFQQVDSSTTRKTGGIGLGLALTRQLCELMGGRLEIQSAVGEGTTVTMRLPILDSHRDFMDSIITEAEVQRTP